MLSHRWTGPWSGESAPSMSPACASGHRGPRRGTTGRVLLPEPSAMRWGSAGSWRRAGRIRWSRSSSSCRSPSSSPSSRDCFVLRLGCEAPSLPLRHLPKLKIFSSSCPDRPTAKTVPKRLIPPTSRPHPGSRLWRAAVRPGSRSCAMSCQRQLGPGDLMTAGLVVALWTVAGNTLDGSSSTPSRR